jgi:uncharacterized protein (TIGR02246 family)
MLHTLNIFRYSFTLTLKQQKMKKKFFVPALAAAMVLLISCGDTATPTVAAEATPVAAAAAPDMASIRSDIQALEDRWAAAMNAKDIDALMAMYADDAISMPPGAPTLTGKAAIKKAQEADFAAPRNYATAAFETTDVYAQGDNVTEIGKSTFKDKAGKVVRTGKYVAVYKKQDGKYLCIREIYSDDSK